MGLFSILTPKKARRLQLFHHDNGDLEFRYRDIIGQSVTEFNERSEPVASWLDTLQTLYQFNGYRNIPGGAVQLACGRYYHLELHNILPDDLAPPNDGELDSEFLSSIANQRAFGVAKAKKPKNIWDKITIILGTSLIMEMALWGIMIYVTRK